MRRIIPLLLLAAVWVPSPGLRAARLLSPRAAAAAASVPVAMVIPVAPVALMLGVAAPAGAVVAVQASADLAHWQVFTNVTLPVAGVPVPASGDHGFYRGMLTHGEVTLSWVPSPDPAVTGYRVYAGSASRDYTWTATVTDTPAVVTVPAWGTNYFALTAVDGAGDESAFSNEAVYSFPKPTLTLTSHQP